MGKLEIPREQEDTRLEKRQRIENGRFLSVLLETGLGIWVRGFTPNYHVQTGIFPFSVNSPISCGGCLVFPGDVIVADDDGAVVVPRQLVEGLVERAGSHMEWEVFSKLKLSEGADIRKYYPLNEEARKEFEEWVKSTDKNDKKA